MNELVINGAISIPKWVVYFVFPAISAGVGFAGALVTYAFKTGKFAETIETALQRFDDHTKKFEVIKGMVYELDRNVMRKPDCSVEHEKQKGDFFKKIDLLHHILEDMDRKREESRRSNSEKWERVFESLGEIRGQLKVLQEEKKGTLT